MSTLGLLKNNYNLVNSMNNYKLSLSKNSERISTGKRINTAADGPADSVRISKLTAQLRGNKVAQRNIQEGISLTQVADDTLKEVSEIGKRLRELSIQHSTGTLTSEDKDNIEKRSN